MIIGIVCVDQKWGIGKKNDLLFHLKKDMEFFKNNSSIRMILIAVSFIIALFLVITGWQMTGQMAGLIKMMVGVAFLLVALKIYNINFEDPKKKK